MRSTFSYLTGFIIFLTLAPCLCSNDGSGKIKVLLTGRVAGGYLISTWFMNEPMVDPLFVPSRDLAIGEMRKFVRIYFPRNYEGVQAQDFFIFAGTQTDMFNHKQQKWIHDAVLDGSGGLNSRTLLSGIYYPEWANSATQKAFPNDADKLMSQRGDIFRSDKNPLIILEENPDLPPVLWMFRNKKIKWSLSGYSCGRIIPREGAIVWSWIKGPFADVATIKPGCTPHLISWQYGDGITWTCHDRLINWWQDTVANPYGLDMIMNMILFSNGRRLPDDIEVVHEIRSRIVEYKTRQLLLLATIEFAEAFGANMNPVLQNMGEINEKRREGDEQYLSQDYILAKATYIEAIQDLEELNFAAMERKDRAMLWVYVVQWSVVSGTSMFAGAIVWTLMIKRKLYRQVKSTRFVSDL